jgi:hypothetical protein
MNKHVLATTAVRLDETIAFLRIKPFSLYQSPRPHSLLASGKGKADLALLLADTRRALISSTVTVNCCL